jgi:hypothetical protein
VALGAVADDGNVLAFNEGEVAVFVVKNVHDISYIFNVGVVPAAKPR